MMSPNAVRWVKSLVAILLGNALYFALNPHLPPPARYNPRQLVTLGTVVDFWFCLLVYGLLELGALLHKVRKR
jgi:hypothetical protein